MSEQLAAVLKQLPADAPYISPRHVAPLLGITENGFTHHCRDTLHNWDGQWRFHTDDPADIHALKRVINKALWAGRKLPKTLNRKPC